MKRFLGFCDYSCPVRVEHEEGVSLSQFSEKNRLLPRMFEGGLAAAADTVVFHFTGEASDIVDGLDLFLPGL